MYSLIYRKFFLMISFSLLIIFFLSCNSDDKVIAYIGNTSFTNGTFYNELRKLYPRNFNIKIGAIRTYFKDIKKLKSQLDNYLEDYVIYSEAKKSNFVDSVYYKDYSKEKIKDFEFDLTGFLTLRTQVLEKYDVDDQQVNFIKYIGALKKKYELDLKNKNLSDEELKKFLLGREGRELKFKDNKEYEVYFSAMKRELVIKLFKDYQKYLIREKLVGLGDSVFIDYYKQNKEKEFKYLKANQEDKSQKTETYLNYAEVREDIISKFVDKDYEKYIKDLFKKNKVSYNKDFFGNLISSEQ